MAGNGRARIAVVGGGFAGLEAAFYIRMRVGERAQITLLSDQDHFLFKPNTIYIPFGLDPDSLKIPLAGPARRKGIEFVQARVRDVDPITRHVYTNGTALSYDFLVVATGAGMRPEEIPGLAQYAETIWTPEDMLRLRSTFESLVRDPGGRQQVVFVVPPNNKCAGPLYEMVFMLETWLRRRRARDRVQISWATYEETFIQAFGPRLHEVVSGEFHRRKIDSYTRFVVERVRHGEVLSRDGQRLAFDVLISFPPYVASTPFLSLPADERGFIQTDPATREVVETPRVYAVGDAGDFPVKQAFLAFLQADAAADHIAAEILGTQPTVRFDPVSMCVMEQFDKATFAQVPLRLTGAPDKPVEVRPDAARLYRVGSSPVWRLGKKLLGLYLPWRFRAGEPFHAGRPWRGMEVGLKVMSRLLAA